MRRQRAYKKIPGNTGLHIAKNVFTLYNYKEQLFKIKEKVIVMLKAGFARGEITPPMGVSVQGYFEPRTAKGILDPLLATAVAFDDG